MLCIGWIFKFFFFLSELHYDVKKNYDAHKTWWDIVKVACACVRGWLWVSFYLTALCNAPGSSEPRLCSRSSSCFRLNLYDQFHSYCHWSFFFSPCSLILPPLPLLFHCAPTLPVLPAPPTAQSTFSLCRLMSEQLSSAPSPHGWWLIISTNVLICVFETLLTVRYLQRRCFHILYQRKTGQRSGFNNDSVSFSFSSVVFFPTLCLPSLSLSLQSKHRH